MLFLVEGEKNRNKNIKKMPKWKKNEKGYKMQAGEESKCIYYYL